MTTAALAITDGEFARFRDLIASMLGIHLSDAKKSLLAGRLAARLRELQCTTFDDYFRLVRRDALEQQTLVDSICTSTTSFFREPNQFQFLESTVYPKWSAIDRPIRIWSAACATGQEPFSIAMSLRDAFPDAEPSRFEIVATDVSQRALDRARSGMWDLALAREIPEPRLKKFMLRGRTNGRMKAGEEIASMISFRRMNLHSEDFAALGTFDVIFCRNVLIYFSAEARRSVLERAMRRLQPAGYLLLGHSESLNGITTRMRSVGPTVYAFRS